MSDIIKEYILALRPWSFTATIVPILVTAAVTNSPFTSEKFFRSLLMGLFIHSGANLTNTYYDYVNGIDTKEHNADPTLVEKKLQPNGILIFSFICYFIGTLMVLPLIALEHRHDIAFVFAAGITLAFFYTGNPVGLKYRALGDITIFLCFGPLLMQCASLIMTDSLHKELYYYTIPIGMLTEAILHANNARDIKSDSQAGAITLASLIGFENSYYFYIFLIYGSYLAAVALAIFFRRGCLLTLITLPLAIKLVQKFKQREMGDLTEETAKFHLPFGITFFLGILFSSQGLL
jgi:menadiol prenyltransferase